MASNKLYSEIEKGMAQSSVQQRKKWIVQMIENQYSVVDFMQMMQKDKKTATRFSWMLSEVGMYQKEYLLEALPILFSKRDEIQLIPFEQSFMNYWLIAGLPTESETEAIELCFKFLNSAEVNVSIKSRALKLLERMIKKYPELKEELKTSIEIQIDRNRQEFKKTLKKALEKLT
jgi:hypothetical protein